MIGNLHERLLSFDALLAAATPGICRHQLHSSVATEYLTSDGSFLAGSEPKFKWPEAHFDTIVDLYDDLEKRPDICKIPRSFSKMSLISFNNPLLRDFANMLRDSFQLTETFADLCWRSTEILGLV